MSWTASAFSKNTRIGSWICSRSRLESPGGKRRGLAEQAKNVEEQLGELLARVEREYGEQLQGAEEGSAPEAEEEPPTKTADRKRIEELFGEATKDRTKAFELKRELDRLGIFKEYEDRFLDLFKKTP